MAAVELVIEPAVEPEPVAAVERVIKPEPASPQPPVAPRSITSIGDTILQLPRRQPIDENRVAATSTDAAVAARRAQLDGLGLGDPGEGPLPASRPNVVPYRSSGASGRSSAAKASQVAGSFWDASAREVAGGLGQVAVQSCGHCGLSLSASARFCRRCGTRQARSA